MQKLPALFEVGRGCGELRAPHGTIQQVGAGPVGTELVTQQALMGIATRQQNGARTVAKERSHFQFGRIDDPAVAVAANDQREPAVAGGHELGGGHERIDESRTRGLDVQRRTVESQRGLNQIGGRRALIVGGEGADDDEINIPRVDMSRANRVLRGFDAQIAGGLFGERVPTFANPGPLFDPCGIKAVSGLQVGVRNDVVWKVGTGTDDLHAQQRTRPLAPAAGCGGLSLRDGTGQRQCGGE